MLCVSAMLIVWIRNQFKLSTWSRPWQGGETPYRRGGDTPQGRGDTLAEGGRSRRARKSLFCDHALPMRTCWSTQGKKSGAPRPTVARWGGLTPYSLSACPVCVACIFLSYLMPHHSICMLVLGPCIFFPGRTPPWHHTGIFMFDPHGSRNCRKGSAISFKLCGLEPIRDQEEMPLMDLQEEVGAFRGLFEWYRGTSKKQIEDRFRSDFEGFERNFLQKYEHVTTQSLK